MRWAVSRTWRLQWRWRSSFAAGDVPLRRCCRGAESTRTSTPMQSPLCLRNAPECGFVHADSICVAAAESTRTSTPMQSPASTRAGS
ncbi:hypothetical protein CHLRE_06g278133v5 [Chlamydomonas reinhardtii]|uniref:Uncharacterized protein n=1 Tax=Chlamydomonas reinhardtii TaxID=3055 RepID=A0A2K3DNX9_CHLRE|nr:uncharacterized protein CHLRE_06g278133v5 [Chlamydomonas reinhardtii]PNW82243.1 hypothetical protein CHLRE_06g278133v5 [Chlamydomonas reinhardtii]